MSFISLYALVTLFLFSPYMCIYYFLIPSGGFLPLSQKAPLIEILQEVKSAIPSKNSLFVILTLAICG